MFETAIIGIIIQVVISTCIILIKRDFRIAFKEMLTNKSFSNFKNELFDFKNKIDETDKGKKHQIIVDYLKETLSKMGYYNKNYLLTILFLTIMVLIPFLWPYLITLIYGKYLFNKSFIELLNELQINKNELK